MSYGLQIQSSSGYVQIDETYANSGLIQSGTTTTGTRVSVSGGLDKCLVFVKIPYGKSITRSYWSSTEFSTYPGHSSDTNYSYEYRVFKNLTQQPTLNGYGLYVFNQTSNLVFSSNYRYSRIAAAANFVIPVNDTNYQTNITIPSIGVQPWILLNTLYTAGLADSGSNFSYVMNVIATLQSNGNVNAFIDVVSNGPYVATSWVNDGSRTLLLAK